MFFWWIDIINCVGYMKISFHNTVYKTMINNNLTIKFMKQEK